MEALKALIVPLNLSQSSNVSEPRDVSRIGPKAAHLRRLHSHGFCVPRGFCLTSDAYDAFVSSHGLRDFIRMELEKKPHTQMRWEEMWDASLRIRGRFQATSLPSKVVAAISAGIEAHCPQGPWAVRSSAPGEDSAGCSFAGIHASLVEVPSRQAVIEAVRVVWASLWSDAAILYRHELGLDPAQSRMAVVIQTMVPAERSGVAFGRDPRGSGGEVEIVEAVEGACALLVDGEVDPDRWILERATGKVLQWRVGQRADAAEAADPLLTEIELRAIHQVLQEVERVFGWAPDVEWTGCSPHLTVLQARPITSLGAPDDERSWYLSLSPSRRRLRALCEQVVGVSIPELTKVGEDLAAELLRPNDDETLADCLEARQAALTHWRQVYREEFIPFAHGIRRLGVLFNDAVRPDDPFAFVGLLTGQPLRAMERNRELAELAKGLRERPALLALLQASSVQGPDGLRERLEGDPNAARLLPELQSIADRHMDISWGSERLGQRLDLLVRLLVELAGSAKATCTSRVPARAEDLEQRLKQALGPDRAEEAEEALRIGRISWQLRDDDNLLLGRVESQLLRAVRLAGDRLRKAGRLVGAHPGERDLADIARSLRDRTVPTLVIADRAPATLEQPDPAGETLRQLVGQAAAPGLATGPVRIVQGPEDVRSFRRGDVLVCDAIQPNMTQLVPLARAIVERRGGMLIHGAIIARELNIPCVNGIPAAAERLSNGQLVTVDGFLGIVTVGKAEFDFG